MELGGDGACIPCSLYSTFFVTKIMYMYHYKFHRTFYFSSLSVHPSRKCIGRYKRIYKKTESPAKLIKMHVLAFPFLTSYVLLDVICTTAPGGRKPHEAIRWGWTKYQVTARGTTAEQFTGHVQATIHQDPHQNNNTEAAKQVFSTCYGWCSLEGDRWSALSGSHRSPCCL